MSRLPPTGAAPADGSSNFQRGTTKQRQHRCRRRLMLAIAATAVSTTALLTFSSLPFSLAEADQTEETKVNVNRVEKLRGLLDSKESFGDLGAFTPAEASAHVLQLLGKGIGSRMETLFAKAVSNECRQKIARHFGYFLTAIGREESLPFTDVTFQNGCGETVYDWSDLPEDMHIGMIQNRTYQPPRNESIYIDDPAHLRLLYAILTHDKPTATIRLVEALYEESLHQFVIHVDAKYADTQNTILKYASDKEYIHVLDDPRRVRVNWGGFSMVNATLMTLQYAFEEKMAFDKFIHLSSSSYPIASNVEIRHKLAEYPLDANFLNVIMQPTRPSNYPWHYFVECDDALHRIYQLPALRREISGADMFTSSQWFIISYDFAEYLALQEPGSFVYDFMKYIEHVVVADETFFGTVLRHTKFCHKHHNSNFLHLHFDRWESDLPAGKRDERKCPMRDPNHCGRSPTIMTLDYADIMELSSDLFARKFDDSVDTQVKDVVDQWRQRRAHAIEHDGQKPDEAIQTEHLDFEGHGVLVVARETLPSAMPLCLAIGETGNKAELLPCFEDWVPPTLASGWEQGAVVLSETIPHTRWSVGPCTSDGKLERLTNGEIAVTPGNYSAQGPRCMLKQMDGIRAGRCLDGGTMDVQPSGETQVYPCVREWFQFFSLGDGRLAPTGSLFSTIPLHIVKQIHNLGHEQIPYLCLGLYGRGDEDELDWDDEDYHKARKQRAARKAGEESAPVKDYEPLSEWQGEAIVTTQCSNIGAVIDWALVPFIDEEQEDTVELVETEGEHAEL